MSRRRAAALAAAALGLAGCGAPGPEEAVEVAERWVDAVAEDRPSDACALMRSTATRSLRAKFFSDRPGGCEQLVQAYAGQIPDAKLRTLREEGLEFDGEVEEERLGVFPVAARYEFEVLLMERADGEWKVASVGILPE